MSINTRSLFAKLFSRLKILFFIAFLGSLALLGNRKEKDKYLESYSRQYKKEKSIPVAGTKFVLVDSEDILFFPDIKEDRKTSLGFDTNKNQVRDDVEIWIEMNLSNYNHRMAAKQYVIAQQKIISLFLKKEISSQDLQNVYLVNEKAKYCIFSLTNYEVTPVWNNHIISILDHLYYNTVDRYTIANYQSVPVKKTKNLKKVPTLNRIGGNELIDQCNFVIQNRDDVFNTLPDYLKSKEYINES